MPSSPSAIERGDARLALGRDKLRRAGEAEEEGHAVEDHRGRRRAEQQVLQAGLGRALSSFMSAAMMYCEMLVSSSATKIRMRSRAPASSIMPLVATEEQRQNSAS